MLLSLSLMSIVPVEAQEIDPATAMQAKEFKTPFGESLKYRIYQPDPMVPGTKYPLVLFFHGAGERGDDNAKQLTHGVKQILALASKSPFILIAPQCPNVMQWVNTPWAADSHVMPEFPSLPMKLALELCETVANTMPVDKSRIYVTGLSMGGFGTWDAIQRKPEFFAAAMPVCGGGDAAFADKIKKVPIWAFHGGKDQAVKVERSRMMIEALKKAGAAPKYTEYPEDGHGIWGKAYGGDGAGLRWLFEQKKVE